VKPAWIFPGREIYRDPGNTGENCNEYPDM
jgi:hypothetical protein